MFFFCCAPLGAATFRRGQRQKKNTTQGVFFCSGPGERQGKEKPRWKPARGQSKKKTPPWVVFFLFALAPCRLPTGLLLPLPFAGATAKKKTPLPYLLRCLKSINGTYSGLFGILGDWFISVIVELSPYRCPETRAWRDRWFTHRLQWNLRAKGD